MCYSAFTICPNAEIRIRIVHEPFTVGHDRHMRTELALSIGISLAMIGLMILVGLISRRSSRPDLGSVSGEWIAEQTRLDIDPR
jgi:hypothetical protein